MIFKRKAYEKMLSWKQSSAGQTALLIEGARRIGKSTIVEEFAKNEYENYLIIDFSTADDTVTELFDMYMADLKNLFIFLFSALNTNPLPERSLIVFDEVQFCPKARQAIKHLVADGRYDYIETGSLISINENVRDILIPSEERTLYMYPMDFEEFLWAIGEDGIIPSIHAMYELKQPLPDKLHNKAMTLFRQYAILGGMPEPISKFLETGGSFYSADEIKRDILNLYHRDIMKINNKYRSRVLSIFEQIPSMLSQHDKRVILNDIEVGSTFDKYEDTFFWLADSKIANMCFLCNDPNIGLSVNENRSYVKCYLGDTGLLMSQAFDESKIRSLNLHNHILAGDMGINNGMLFENVIAQNLVANGYKLYFYKHYSPKMHKNDIEIDFIIPDKNELMPKIIPIEVKSGSRYTTKSLKRFNEKFKNRVSKSIIIHPRNLSIKEDGPLCLPAYMVICL